MKSKQSIIQHYIQSQYQHLPEMLIYKQKTTSTNDDLLQLCKQLTHLSSALICSEQQSLGRGQHHRQWVSPQGNIYMSALASLNRPVDGRFSLEVALNIINSPQLMSHDLNIKWVNDLYSPLGKWGGILIEPVRENLVIVGVGINIQALNSQQKAEIEQATTSLNELNIQVEREKLIADVYIAIQNAVQWFNYGSQNLSRRFNHVAYLYGQYVTFEHQQHILTGKYLGIADDGALLLQYNEQIQAFYNGRLKGLQP